MKSPDKLSGAKLFYKIGLCRLLPQAPNSEERRMEIALVFSVDLNENESNAKKVRNHCILGVSQPREMQVLHTRRAELLGFIVAQQAVG